MLDAISFLWTTDFRYIMIAFILLVTAVFAAAGYNAHMAKATVTKDELFVLTDYTYRDDKGNLYVVTSADISDNWSLLIEEYDLSAAYISKHVFLVDARTAI